MTLAFKVVLPSTQKFVLVALCDSANDQGECYPSVPSLMEKCCLSERAVQGALAALVAGGHVQREFRRGRSTTYTVNPRTTCTPGETTTPADSAPRPRTSRTPAPDAPPQDMHPTPADSAPTPPHVVHPTPAPGAPITVKEPSIEPSGNRKESAARAPTLPRPTDVTEKTWRDWCALRKAKRAPVSETVVDGAREEADKAQMTLERFLAVWCMRGSQGLQASWLKPEERSVPGGSAPVRRGQMTDADLAAANAAADAEAHRRLFGDQETIDA